MKHLLPPLLGAGLLLAPPAGAQDLTNAGATVTVLAGAMLYVGTGGLANQAGGVLTNQGALRVDGPLANPGALDLGAGSLEVKGDFTNTGTLLPGTSPVAFTGATDQLLAPGGATLYQVVVNKPTAGANALRLAGDLSVSNRLTLANGLLTTQNGAALFTLRLPDGAALAGEAPGRYVLGALQVTRNAVNGAPVNFGHGAVLDPTTNALGAVSVTRTAGLLTADVSFGQNLAAPARRGIDCVWTVTPAVQPAAPVRLTLSWLPDNDHGLADFTQARVWQQPAPGQPWNGVGPAANASARSLTSTPLVLNRFTVSNAANPLPVNLVDFSARAEGLTVRLAWATASELNNAGFAVERSTDGRGFAEVGTVAGAGTSTARRDYALLDNGLPAGHQLLYYRLRQTDLNGHHSYSAVRPVTLSPLAAGFAVYPTPVAVGQAATYLYTGPAQPGTLHVLNVVGQVVRTLALDGRAQGPVPLEGLARGAYLLRYTGPAGRFTARCVVD